MLERTLCLRFPMTSHDGRSGLRLLANSEPRAACKGVESWLLQRTAFLLQAATPRNKWQLPGGAQDSHWADQP